MTSFPVTLPNLPTVWRGDPYSGICAMGDSASIDEAGAITVVNPVDLSTLGTSWTSQIRTSIAATLVAAEFAIDITHLADGYLILSLTGDQTFALRRGVPYGFDVQAAGGLTSPFTVWKGSLVVDGEWTRA